MKQMRYLNVILTINAALLACVLYTQLIDRPILATQAQAQTQAVPPGGIPNAGKQREQIVVAVQELARDVQKTNRLLEGELKVTVTNAREMRADGGNGR